MRALAIATIAAASLATAANSATITTYDVSGWEMAAFTDDKTGRFTHCAASARYRNGQVLLFSLSESLQWAIGFSNSEWNLRQGREFNVEYRIDGGAMNSARGIAANSRLIRATLPDSAALFNQFRLGYRLVVMVDDNSPVTFNLTNTNPMLAEILRCAQKYKGYADRTNNNAPRQNDRDPRTGERDTGPRSDNRPRDENRQPQAQSQNERNRGSGSSGSYSERNENNRLTRMPDRDDDRRQPERETTRTPVNTPVGPTVESRAEATAIATDILRRANFAFELQKADDKNDVSWRSEEFLGTLRILPGVRADTVEQTRNELISSDSKLCKGKFDSGTLPAMADSKSVTMFTSCKGEPASSTYYILLPRRKGGVYLLGILGSGEAAARVQNVVTAYRIVALEVLEK